MTQALEQAGAKGLADYGGKCTEQLNRIVGLVSAPVACDVGAARTVLPGRLCAVGFDGLWRAAVLRYAHRSCIGLR